MMAEPIAPRMLRLRQRKRPAMMAKKTRKNASDSGWAKIQTSFEMKNKTYSLKMGGCPSYPIRR
jgi:hypothetical protein